MLDFSLLTAAHRLRQPKHSPPAITKHSRDFFLHNAVYCYLITLEHCKFQLKEHGRHGKVGEPVPALVVREPGRELRYTLEGEGPVKVSPWKLKLAKVRFIEQTKCRLIDVNDETIIILFVFL